MRILFAGTPEAAVPSLQALLRSDHEVAAVLTRPDAPTGRGRRLAPSPVRRAAQEAGVPVLMPRTLRDPVVQEQLREIAPEAAPVVAYGNLVPPAALEIPEHGWINLHFSLLPAWRGAAPAQRAVLSGARRTGLSTFRLDAGLDTGDLLAQEETAIGATETAGELLARMAGQGAELLLRSLDAIADGSARFTPQREEGASHAPKLSPAEARIRWDRPAAEVSAHIRGMSPDPGAWSTLRGARMKVLGVQDPAQLPPETGPALAPGELRAGRRALWVGTADDPLALGTLAPAGKRAMAAVDWARGAGLAPGEGFAVEDDGDQSSETNNETSSETKERG